MAFIFSLWEDLGIGKAEGERWCSTAITGEVLLAMCLTGLIVSNVLWLTQTFQIFPEVTTRESKIESQFLVKNGWQEGNNRHLLPHISINNCNLKWILSCWHVYNWANNVCNWVPKIFGGANGAHKIYSSNISTSYLCEVELWQKFDSGSMWDTERDEREWRSHHSGWYNSKLN